ncbi:MAG: TolC family protein [Sulfuricurvum sp.]|uniref:TolC family protein n=1 Tax=Sulfuricurvum sp. TaxID=2025608 RepID=UPI0026035CFE|nr:TolC family protein [Sulfuricurvum sp.]MDD2829640.1 TolC family protein [Sulfuricurvum sp.]MDD4948692.1 TolC family protein [Sulfuricurvum sp.]
MKPQYLTVISLFLLANLWGQEDTLSPQKRSLIQHQQEIIDAENEKLRTNWISPINLMGSYTYDKSASGSYHSDTENFSASLSQDIFRSGGITYQIEYADAKKRGDSILLNQQIASLNAQIFSSLLSYKKTALQCEQSKARLANKEIEIFIKRQLYEAGKSDITELNNALMDKSNEQKNYVLLTYTLADYRYEIAKISDINPDTFPLPIFKLIDKEDYLKSEWNIQAAYAQNETLENLYEVTKSNYLPKISLNADAGYRDYNPRELSGGYSGNFYSGGISMSIPITYNRSATIQQSKATAMEQTALIQDKRRELDASYNQTLERLKNYRSYIEIISKNLTLYDELIGATKAGVDAGVKTGYDFQTLKNTKSIEEIEIKINEINIQIELSKLHFSMNKESK